MPSNLTSIKNNFDLRNKKNLFLSIFGLSLFLIVTTSNHANAACCRCAIPEIDGTVCIQNDITPCADLAQTNKDFKDATCTVETKDASCKLIKDGGICFAGPMNVLSFKLTDYVKKTTETKKEETTYTPALIKLNVDIPGLSFTDPYLDGNQVIIPYLGQYIQALYKFLLGVALIASAIMIVLGGYKYIIASTGAKVESGKQMIIDALMGMVIVLGAYVILSNVNPNLTQFGSLTVPFVKPTELDLGNYGGTAPMGPMDGSVGIGSDASKNDIVEIIKKVSSESGVDPCVMLSICEHETGLRSIWSGYPNSDKYNAVAYGPCQIHKMHVYEGSDYTGYWAKKARAKFPDFPPEIAGSKITEDEKKARIDWMLNNPEGSIWIATNIFRSISSTVNNNEVLATASYGSGYGSIKNWINKTSCKTQPLTIKAATSMSVDNALKVSCVPKTVTIAKSGEECASDNFACADMKADQKAVLRGHCPSDPNKNCVGMKTGDFATYVIKAYPRFNSTYNCTE